MDPALLKFRELMEFTGDRLAAIERRLDVIEAFLNLKLSDLAQLVKAQGKEPEA